MVVNRMLAAKRANTLAGTSPKADTCAPEAEIDQRVYALYGLSLDEIEFVEGGA